MGRPKIPGKCPAFESISLVLQICDVFSIGAVTAKELLLLTLSFIGILKQNSLSVFPLTFLFTIVGFFSARGRFGTPQVVAVGLLCTQMDTVPLHLSVGCGCVLQPRNHRGPCAAGLEEEQP